MSLRPVEEVLRESGLRATPQRLAVYEALRVLSHPDAETIYGHVQNHHASLSLATVYHVLDRFNDAGLIGILDVNGRRHYDILPENHDHLWCRGCGEIRDVLPSSDVGMAAPTEEGWIVEGMALVWLGLCADCQSARESHDGL